MDNLFTQASRLKYRFDTMQGSLSVEDLWDLPLQTIRAGKVSLDMIAIGLNKKLKDSNATSFVDEAPVGNDELQAKFDIVLHIINVRKAENAAEATKRARAEQKQQLLTLIAQKENEALAGKSIDELRELVNAL